MWARSKTRVKIWKPLFSSLIFANEWGVHTCKCDFLLSSFLSGAKYDESCQGSWRRELVSPTSKVPIRPGGIHDNRPTVKGDIMPYYSGVYPAWPLESSKTPRKLWHTWGSLYAPYLPVYTIKPFLNALSFWWKLRITIFIMKEQLQSFHFNIHIRISCTDCLLSETLKQKVLFSSESGQSKNFQTLLCKMMKNKKTHVNLSSDKQVFIWMVTPQDFVHRRKS